MHTHVDSNLYGIRWLAYTAMSEYKSIIPVARIITGHFIRSNIPSVCTSKYINNEAAPISIKPMAKNHLKCTPLLLRIRIVTSPMKYPTSTQLPSAATCIWSVFMPTPTKMFTNIELELHIIKPIKSNIPP